MLALQVYIQDDIEKLIISVKFELFACFQSI